MYLKKLYYDAKFPGSYSGFGKFYREVKKIHPNVKKETIRQFLQAESSYSLHKPIKKPHTYRKTISFHKNDLWQIDLLDLQKFSIENQGFRYLCVIIDCFTRYVWVKPLKNKTGESLRKALALLIMNERPSLIQADQGTEFFNTNVKKMLEAFGPKLYHTFSDKKATIVERVQRTLRLRLGRLFTKQGNNNWIDSIDDIVHSYNNTYHRGIKMSPSQVNEAKTANMFYSNVRNRAKRDTVKFKVGDKVRIFGKKKQFQKEFEEGWLREIFRIKVVQKTNPITYLVEDLKGETLAGCFYSTEIQHAT